MGPAHPHFPPVSRPLSAPSPHPSCNLPHGPTPPTSHTRNLLSGQQPCLPASSLLVWSHLRCSLPHLIPHYPPPHPKKRHRVFAVTAAGGAVRLRQGAKGVSKAKQSKGEKASTRKEASDKGPLATAAKDAASEENNCSSTSSNSTNNTSSSTAPHELVQPHS